MVTRAKSKNELHSDNSPRDTDSISTTTQLLACAHASSAETPSVPQESLSAIETPKVPRGKGPKSKPKAKAESDAKATLAPPDTVNSTSDDAVLLAQVAHYATKEVTTMSSAKGKVPVYAATRATAGAAASATPGASAIGTATSNNTPDNTVVLLRVEPTASKTTGAVVIPRADQAKAASLVAAYAKSDAKATATSNTTQDATVLPRQVEPSVWMTAAAVAIPCANQAQAAAYVTACTPTSNTTPDSAVMYRQAKPSATKKVMTTPVPASKPRSPNAKAVAQTTVAAASDDETESDTDVLAEKEAPVIANAHNASLPLVSTKAPFAIQHLTPDLKDWTLVGRVLSRSPIRTWKNLRGQGKVFDFRIIDKVGDTIKASVFADGVDLFERILQNGSTCAFSGGKVKPCDKKYTGDSFELAFDHRATIVISNGDHASNALAEPPLPIRAIEAVTAGSKVTVAGIVQAVDPAKRFTTAVGESRFKRDFLLVDDTLTKVVVTLWGYTAREDSSEFVGKPAIVRSATVTDYQGVRSLSALAGSSALAVSDSLKNWYVTTPEQSAFSFIAAPNTD